MHLVSLLLTALDLQAPTRMCQLETWDALLVRLGGCTASGSASLPTLVASSLARGQCLCKTSYFHMQPPSSTSILSFFTILLHTCHSDGSLHTSPLSLYMHVPCQTLILCKAIHHPGLFWGYTGRIFILQSASSIVKQNAQHALVWTAACCLAQLWQMHTKEAGIWSGCAFRLFPFWCACARRAKLPAIAQASACFVIVHSIACCGSGCYHCRRQHAMRTFCVFTILLTLV